MTVSVRWYPGPTAWVLTGVYGATSELAWVAFHAWLLANPNPLGCRNGSGYGAAMVP